MPSRKREIEDLRRQIARLRRRIDRRAGGLLAGGSSMLGRIRANQRAGWWSAAFVLIGATIALVGRYPQFLFSLASCATRGGSSESVKQPTSEN